LSRHHSGVVLFGFGETELFPSVVRQLHDETPFGILRIPLREIHTFEKDGAFILPIADREVMDLLIQGVSDRFKEIVSASMRMIASEIVERTIRENMILDQAEFTTARQIT